MIDTIGLESPTIPECLAQRIESQSILRRAVDMVSGELLYQLTSCQLEGSYDSRIHISVKRERFQSIQTVDYIREVDSLGKGHKRRVQTVLVSCEPYLYLEGSVHKALLGHNVFGGTADFQVVAYWLLGRVGDLLGVDLLGLGQWVVRRCDVAECFQLDSFSAVQEYFRGLNSAEYPRRPVTRYGASGIYAPGYITTVKMYHKGVEFLKHDRPRLSKRLSIEQLTELQEQANLIVRTEVEIKARKFVYDFGRLLQIGEVDQKYLDRIYDEGVRKLLKEGEDHVKVVRSAVNVERRLYNVYSSRQAGVLLGTWYRLSAMGESRVKEQLPERTFYRHRRLLKMAGCGWLGTDVTVRNLSLVPQDFVPVVGDSRRLIGVHPLVLEQLQAVS